LQAISRAGQPRERSISLARRNNSPRFVALALLSLAALHDQVNRPEDAAREAREALQYFQSDHCAQETFQCLALLGRAQTARGDYPSSYCCLWTAPPQSISQRNIAGGLRATACAAGSSRPRPTS